MTYALETKAETSNTRQMLEANMMTVLRKIVGKTKIDRIRSQKMIESCDINEWVERKRREWNEHITKWILRD